MINSLYVKIIGGLLAAGILSGGAGLIGASVGQGGAEEHTKNVSQASCLTANKDADCDSITDSITQKSDEEIEGLINDLKGVVDEK